MPDTSFGIEDSRRTRTYLRSGLLVRTDRTFAWGSVNKIYPQLLLTYIQNWGNYLVALPRQDPVSFASQSQDDSNFIQARPPTLEGRTPFFPV